MLKFYYVVNQHDIFRHRVGKQFNKITAMKKLTKTSLIIVTALCLIVTSFSSFANLGYDQRPVHQFVFPKDMTEPVINLFWDGHSETLNLVIENPGGQRISVSLLDESGSTLLKSIFPKSQPTIEKNYVFADADDGIYSIEVYDGKQVFRKKIKLERVQHTDAIVKVL
jgi:hypothetical protein